MVIFTSSSLNTSDYGTSIRLGLGSKLGVSVGPVLVRIFDIDRENRRIIVECSGVGKSEI